MTNEQGNIFYGDADGQFAHVLRRHLFFGDKLIDSDGYMRDIDDIERRIVLLGGVQTLFGAQNARSVAARG